MKINLNWQQYVMLIVITLMFVFTVKASSVEGRIVDTRGKPISGANILLYPSTENSNSSEGELDFNIIHLTADNEGKFSFVPEFKEFLLCSTYPPDNKVFTPFPINYGCSRDNSKFVKVDERIHLTWVI